MDMFNYFILLFEWAVKLGGVGVFVFGAFQVWQSMGENGTGQQRQEGIVKVIGGVAIFALSSAIPVLFTAPPTLGSLIACRGLAEILFGA